MQACITGNRISLATAHQWAPDPFEFSDERLYQSPACFIKLVQIRGLHLLRVILIESRMIHDVFAIGVFQPENVTNFMF